jgi:hypothetical protein
LIGVNNRLTFFFFIEMLILLLIYFLCGVFSADSDNPRKLIPLYYMKKEDKYYLVNRNSQYCDVQGEIRTEGIEINANTGFPYFKLRIGFMKEGHISTNCIYYDTHHDLYVTLSVNFWNKWKPELRKLVKNDDYVLEYLSFPVREPFSSFDDDIFLFQDGMYSSLNPDANKVEYGAPNYKKPKINELRPFSDRDRNRNFCVNYPSGQVSSKQGEEPYEFVGLLFPNGDYFQCTGFESKEDFEKQYKRFLESLGPVGLLVKGGVVLSVITVVTGIAVGIYYGTLPDDLETEVIESTASKETDIPSMDEISVPIVNEASCIAFSLLSILVFI